MHTSTKLVISAILFEVSTIAMVYVAARLPAGYFFADPIYNAFAIAVLSVSPLIVVCIVLGIASTISFHEQNKDEEAWRGWKFKSTRKIPIQPDNISDRQGELRAVE
jgi:hypothetical protein